VELALGYKQTEAGVIPQSWNVTTIGDEFSIQLGKMLDAEKNVGVPKPYLGNRAVQWGQIDLSDIGFIKLTSSDLQRFRLREGDLLVCEGGEIGRAAIWRQSIEECYRKHYIAYGRFAATTFNLCYTCCSAFRQPAFC